MSIPSRVTVLFFQYYPQCLPPPLSLSWFWGQNCSFLLFMIWSGGLDYDDLTLLHSQIVTISSSIRPYFRRTRNPNWRLKRCFFSIGSTVFLPPSVSGRKRLRSCFSASIMPAKPPCFTCWKTRFVFPYLFIICPFKDFPISLQILKYVFYPLSFI